MMNLAYVAGLVDGEGCIGIYHRSKGRGYQAALIVSNTHRGVLELLQSAFGGDIVTARSRRLRPCHQWRITDRAAMPLAQALLPYMVIKAPQMALLVAFGLLREEFRHAPRRPGLGHDYWERQDSLAQACRWFNQGGVRN